MLKTFYLLYVVVGGGALSSSWGGPALLRFEALAECEAAVRAMRGRIGGTLWHIECIRVDAAVN